MTQELENTNEVFEPVEWEFDNIVTTERDGEIKKYNSSMSAFNLAFMFENNILIYVPEIQRGQKVTKKGKVKDVYSQKHVKEILQAMLKGDIHGGVITLNYSLDDNEESLEYDEENRILNGCGQLQILDGSHRIRACLMWKQMYEKEPDSVPNPENFHFPIIIENLTNDDAKMLFSEYTLTGLKINKTRGKLLNVKDMANKMARKLMNNSELEGKVEIVSTSIKGKNAVVTFGVLNDAIQQYFKPKTNKEADKMVAFLIDFFDELVNLYPNQLGDVDIHTRNEERKKSFILEPIFWSDGLFRIAAELMGDKNWIEKLAKLREEIKIGKFEGEFLNKNNPLFKSIFRDENKIINNTGTRKLISNLVYEYIINDKIEQ